MAAARGGGSGDRRARPTHINWPAAVASPGSQAADVMPTDLILSLNDEFESDDDDLHLDLGRQPALMGSLSLDLYSVDDELERCYCVCCVYTCSHLEKPFMIESNKSLPVACVRAVCWLSSPLTSKCGLRHFSLDIVRVD